MADIVLVQPKIGIEKFSSYSISPPWGLIYSSALASDEYEIKIIDQRLDDDWDKQLLGELKKQPLCVGVSSKVGDMVNHSLEISKVVKQNSNVPVVWGGPLSGIIPQKILENENVDAVVTGEGEVTLYELAKALDKGHELDGIAGVWFKKNNKIHANPDRNFIDLNKLPELPLKLVDMRRYVTDMEGYNSISLVSSRGCPRGCKFCYNLVFNKGKWRALSAKKTVELMKRIVDEFRVNRFVFMDDNMFVDTKRILDIVKHMKKNEKGIVWSAYTDIEKMFYMRDSELKLLKEGGLYGLVLGLESGSERVLSEVNKNITVKQTLDVNQRLKAHGVIPYYFAMVGFPGESDQDLQHTISLILKILEDNPAAQLLFLHSFTPYYGTEMNQTALSMGFKEPQELQEWSNFGGHKVIVPWVSPEKKKELESLVFLANFIDNKYGGIKSKPVRLIAGLYKPIAKYRFKSRDYGFMIELKIRDILRFLLENAPSGFNNSLAAPK